MMGKRMWACLFLGGALGCAAQNITDLSVVGDLSADREVLNIGTAPSIHDSVFLCPGRIRYDHRCFQIEGEDVFLFSGTFHYFRVPCPLWADRFRKLKEAGFNCVETYVPWNWHERTMPRSVRDDSHLDMQDLEAFLQMAEEFGLYVILRPGPYICAEWAGGGFPQWLMRKKPGGYGGKVWLQSNDPEFMRWNEHWYRAVCRVAAPYQLTRKPKGKTGIVLFQLENEFNRVKWFTADEKKAYLESLALMARKYGIEVPFVTCWTNEARNVESGVLDGVLDMVNSYPRWQIKKNFGRLVNVQLCEQPGKPLVSGELQGGWCCELGWPLSWNQDGLPPVQTQNIALYALQRGFGALNFYMAVGGTNFDDWAARQQITSYDYAAAIGEGGLLNERFRRFQGVAAFVHAHGTRVARADLVRAPYVSTDKDVELAVRKCANGDRYFFVRTEERSRSHFGTIRMADIALDFALEPFGSQVYYLPAGAATGTWYPELPPPKAHAASELPSVALAYEGGMSDPLPSKWHPLGEGETVDGKGIYGHHFVYYRTKAYQGCILEVGRVGKNEMNRSAADTVLVLAEGRLVSMAYEDAEKACYRMPGDSAGGKRTDVVLLFESRGLHHHVNEAVEKYWHVGPAYVRSRGEDLSLSYAYVEKERGEAWSVSGVPEKRASDGADAGNPLLKWHFFSFEGVDVPEGAACFLYLKQKGNGFIYVNGHCIGRCYEEGSQREYYVPECWLHADRANVVAVSLRPTLAGNEVEDAAIRFRR